jgi:hypothetical protein
VRSGGRLSNSPHFGKRRAQVAWAGSDRDPDGAISPAGRAVASGFEPTSTLTTEGGLYQAASRRLHGVSQKIRLTAELVAFAGLMLAFLAHLMWPGPPAGLEELEGRIFIPALIAEYLPLDALQARQTTADMTSSEIDMKSAVVPLIALVGLIAIARGRWILAGLISAFWLIPWSFFDHHFLPSPVVVYVYAVAFFFRLFRPSWRLCILLVPLAVLAGSSAIRAIAPPFIAAVTDPDRPKAHYRIVQFSELMKNEQSATRENTERNKAASVSSFLGVRLEGKGAAERAALAYTVAQEQALRGNAEAAATALKMADDLGFRPEPYNQRRVTAIREYVAATGALGPEAQQLILSEYKVQSATTLAAHIVGIILGLLGPFADVLGTRIGRRARHIAEAREKLDTRRAELDREELSTRLRELKASEPTQSRPAMSGDTFVAAITGRIRSYRIAAGSLTALALISLFSAYYLWLPTVDSNTAFDAVALTGDAARLARQAGIRALPAEGLQLLEPLVFPLLLLGLFASLFLIRKRRPLLLTAFAGAVLFKLLGTLGLDHRASYEVPVGALSADLRHVLEQSVQVQEANLEQATPAETDAPPKRDEAPTFRDLRRALDAPTPARRTAVEPSVAAYTLAQIAYLEDRPAEAGHMLAKITDPGLLTALIHHQRVEVMSDWAAAKGYPLSHEAKAPSYLLIPMRFTRHVAHVLFGLGLAVAMLAFVPLGLLAIAETRGRRIRALVDERRQRHATLTAAPQI